MNDDFHIGPVCEACSENGVLSDNLTNEAIHKVEYFILAREVDVSPTSFASVA